MNLLNGIKYTAGIPLMPPEDQLKVEGLNEQIDEYYSSNAMTGQQLGHAKEGEQLFNLLCADCHAYSNTGDTFIMNTNAGGFSTNVDAPPVDEMGVDEMGNQLASKELSEAYLSATIQRGKSSLAKAHYMPAWGHILSEMEIHDLVAFIKMINQSERLP